MQARVILPMRRSSPKRSANTCPRRCSASSDGLIAIAAPHVSPFGGVEAYRAAYQSLTPAHAERTFVILGTSHYGAPDRLGLTRKPFVTPFGEAVTDTALVDRLAAEAGNGAFMEDYCHAVEHSIEFQVVFLQYLFGPSIRIVPVLCGSFARSMYQGGMPEDDERVRRALGALGEMAAKEGDRLLWVLGVDMAHMGRRYGDAFEAKAGLARWKRWRGATAPASNGWSRATPAAFGIWFRRIATT